MKISNFQDFMFELGSPFGWDESFQNNIERQNEFIKRIDMIKFKDDKYY